MQWYTVKNDVVGGWSVSDLDKPISQHPQFNNEGMPYGYIIAECMTKEDADAIRTGLETIKYVAGYKIK